MQKNFFKKIAASTSASFLQVSLCIGFFVGFLIAFHYHRRALYDLILNRYMEYKMYQMMMSCFGNFFSKCFFWFVAVSAFSMCVYLFCKHFLVQTLSIKIKNVKQIKIFTIYIFCFFIFLFQNWIINGYIYFFLTDKPESVSILARAWFLVFVILLGRILYKIKPGKIALVLTITLIIINLGFIVNNKINSAKGPNIILICVDALRADHLGCYGYARNTSPSIDKFAEDGIVFTRVFTQDTRTPPCFSSIFTSLYVKTHGVIQWNKLSDRFTTMAEILSNSGYITAAFVNTRMLSANGLGQGFLFQKEALPRFAKVVNEHVKQWLNKLRKNKRFFLFLHYYDVHRPYDPRKPFDTAFEQGYKGSVNGSEETIMRIHDGKLTLTKEDINHLDALYDGSIKEFDTDFSKLIDFLKSKGLYDDSIIIITADHGEMMGYHPKRYFKYVHDASLYNGVINVPLIIKLPHNKHAGKRFNCLIESIDILPTAISYLGIGKSLDLEFQGRDFSNIFESDNESVKFRDFIVSETYSGGLERRAILKDQHKYIYTVDFRMRELYDLNSDPLELNNIFSQKQTLAQELHNTLENFFKELPKGPEDKDFVLSDEVREELKALGYL